MTGRQAQRPRIGLRISVEADDMHRGKIMGFRHGEAHIKWDGGFESYIDVLDLHKPDGSTFDSYEIAEPSP